MPLAAQMNVPVYGLQCTYETPLNSIEDVATHYIKHIKSIQKTGPYIIAGYSYGGVIAFEITIQLEKLGETVRLALLDGSPSYVKQYTDGFTKRNYKNTTQVQKESHALAYFALNCGGLDYINVSLLIFYL